MDKIKNILFLFFAGGNSRPDAFAPAHAGLASGALHKSGDIYEQAFVKPALSLS